VTEESRLALGVLGRWNRGVQVILEILGDEGIKRGSALGHPFRGPVEIIVHLVVHGELGAFPLDTHHGRIGGRGGTP